MLADRAGVLHHRHPTGQPAGALDRVGRWHRARRHCNGNRQQLRARLTVEGGALTALCAHQREQPSAVVLPPSPLRASATVDREARAQRHRPLHLAPRPTPPHHTPRRTTHTTTTNIVRRAPAPARRTTTEPNHYRGTHRGSGASGLPVSSPGITAAWPAPARTPAAPEGRHRRARAPAPVPVQLNRPVRRRPTASNLPVHMTGRQPPLGSTSAAGSGPPPAPLAQW